MFHLQTEVLSPYFTFQPRALEQEEPPLSVGLLSGTQKSYPLSLRLVGEPKGLQTGDLALLAELTPRTLTVSVKHLKTLTHLCGELELLLQWSPQEPRLSPSPPTSEGGPPAVSIWVSLLSSRGPQGTTGMCGTRTPTSTCLPVTAEASTTRAILPECSVASPLPTPKAYFL